MAKLKLTDEQVAAIVALAIKELTAILEEYEVTKKIIDKGKRIADQGLDLLEAKAASTATKIDDAIVLPTCKIIRSTLNIPEYNT